jgi:hypothetical protein
MSYVFPWFRRFLMIETITYTWLFTPWCVEYLLLYLIDELLIDGLLYHFPILALISILAWKIIYKRQIGLDHH